MSISVKNNKVLIGLSGGVDSAVSAWLLLKAGYSVEGVFMKNWSETSGLLRSDCPWLTDRREALKVAAFLGIKLHTLDFEKEYEEKVMEYFFENYKNLQTPNPDVFCNKEIKFNLLYKWAMDQGFDYLATGHYAATDGSVLAIPKDTFKDQTYFIYNIKPDQLPHLIFPLQDYLKGEVKKLAKKIGLPNAERKESMGICFVGKIRLQEFLSQKIKPKPGNIVDTKGNILGKHQGLHNFTLGQREGINLSSGPWYVLEKNPENNTLVVGHNPHDEKLKFGRVNLHSLNWLSEQIPDSVIKCRFRHQGQLVDCEVSKQKTGAKVVFKDPQYSLASGQSIVLYKDSIVLGGGIIN